MHNTETTNNKLFENLQDLQIYKMLECVVRYVSDSVDTKMTAKTKTTKPYVFNCFSHLGVIIQGLIMAHVSFYYPELRLVV